MWLLLWPVLSDVTDVWLCGHDVTLTLTLDPKIKKRKEKRKRKRKLNKIEFKLYISDKDVLKSVESSRDQSKRSLDSKGKRKRKKERRRRYNKKKKSKEKKKQKSKPKKENIMKMKRVLKE